VKIGYACLAIAVPGSEMKNCTLKNATEERLLSLIEHNLNSLNSLIDYNIRNGIQLFRISSDLIPFGSSLASELPWHNIYAKLLAEIGLKIVGAGLRVSMHPGQYTVLNSPDKSVALRAVQDLDYHEKVLTSLGLGPEHKIILHLGGVYGDKNSATSRFISRYKELTHAVQSRLALENDDKLFNIRDVLDTAIAAGMPVVYDVLHNSVNPADNVSTDIDWITRCSITWKKSDGPQKIHYSHQSPAKRPGAHSESIQIDTFLEFYQKLSGLDVDVMLEVKDKNLSALKCLNCVSNRSINMLEVEWARYKYLILERSPSIYLSIRKLLQDKKAYPALEMYHMIEASADIPIDVGNSVNAAQHVWGYFKEKASESERTRFQRILKKFTSGETGVQPVKNMLLMLARKYQEDILLNGYYFYM
jgi:UV DNA damage endonuclease